MPCKPSLKKTKPENIIFLCVDNEQNDQIRLHKPTVSHEASLDILWQ